MNKIAEEKNSATETYHRSDSAAFVVFLNG